MEITVEDLPDESQKPIQSPLAAARSSSISHLAIKDQFSIDIASGEEEGKLQEIWAYAKSMANSEDINDVVYEVIHLKGKVGQPRLGESYLDRAYRYCKLKRHEAITQEQLRGLNAI